MQLASIRVALEQTLNFPVADELMEFLVARGYVEDVQIDARDINELADIARDVIRAGGGVSGGRKAPRMLRRENGSKEPSPTPLLRSQALSVLLGKEAEKETEVLAFRQEALGGNLLDVDQVDSWVKSQAAQDGRETLWLKVPVVYDSDGSITSQSVSGDSSDSWRLESKESSVLGDFEIRYVEYSVPGGEWLQLQFTASGGVLERLWRISRLPMARSYPWTTAQWTMFVLTGLYPEVRGIETHSVVTTPFKAATRVTLVIDPTVTPDEVRDEYRRVRQEILVGKYKTRSDKHLRLAAFIAERPDTESWQDRMLAWNKAYPGSGFEGYEYYHRSNFTRDARRVCQGLLNPEIRFSWAAADKDWAEFFSGDR